MQSFEPIFGKVEMEKEIFDKFNTYTGLRKYNFGLK